MTNDELIKKAKPCPFCGSKRIVFDKQGAGHGDFSPVIKCKNCGGRVVEYLGYDHALRKWNSRAGK